MDANIYVRYMRVLDYKCNIYTMINTSNCYSHASLRNCPNKLNPFRTNTMRN